MKPGASFKRASPANLAHINSPYNYPLDNLNFNREKPDFLEICEFQQITSHRLAANVFCVHVYI